MAPPVGRIVRVAALSVALAVHGAAAFAARVGSDAADGEQDGSVFGPGRLGVPAFVGEDADPTLAPMLPEEPEAPAEDPPGPAAAPPAAEPPGSPAGGSEAPAPEAPAIAPADLAPPADGPDAPAAEPGRGAGEPAPPASATPPSATPPADGAAPSDAPGPGRTPNLFGPNAPGEGPGLQPGQEVLGPPASTEPLPEVHYGDADLPEPVKKMRAAILEAARSGDIEALRPVLETNEMPPTLAKEDTGDPIAYLKGISGDQEGREILAILIDLLEAGWVRKNPGTPQEMYVWPYFAEIPVDRLTPGQLVELYRILTSADVDELRAYDAWLFFTIGIGPDGTWHSFMINEE